MSQSGLVGLALALVQDGVMAESDALVAMKGSKESGKDIITFLYDQNILDESKLAASIAKEYNLTLFNWDDYSPQLVPKNSIDGSLFAGKAMMPLALKNNGALLLAISNPSSMRDISSLRFATNLNKIEVVLAERGRILEVFDEHFAGSSKSALTTDDLMDSLLGDTANFDVQPNALNEVANDENAPVIKYINQILREAIGMRASDLHFEPFEDSYRIRFRIDGILRLINTLPILAATRFTSRLKVLAQMDISEKRNPQDGRIRFRLNEAKTIDFRVSSLPTVFGEKVVLRILDQSSAFVGIDALGFTPEQKELYLEALERPQGMILITGPTGSGKTVSLYTGLNILNSIDRNISTAEDPVEINLPGVSQVSINARSGLTFAKVLRAFLRQDPDVVMVGEIRDLETAEISIQAAQTGHLVLSTLHTNSAAETLTRLKNMGVPVFNIATSVNLVIAQRLARRLCQRCRTEMPLTEAVRLTLIQVGFTTEEVHAPHFKIYDAKGCNACNNGYQGRMGIYEVIKVTPQIANLIMEDGNALDIAKLARSLGFTPLRRSGLNKVLNGLTTVQEVLRITSE